MTRHADRREDRRARAEVRAVVRAERSDAEQVVVALSRPGESRREVARLRARIAGVRRSR